MTAQAPLDPYGVDADDLASRLPGEPRYRAEQVRRWLARGVDDPADMTDLPLALRERLATVLPPPLRLLRRTSDDAGLTHKALLSTAGGRRSRAC